MATETRQLTVMESVTVLRVHTHRLVSDDPYRPRAYSKVCVLCHTAWPCAARLDADWTIRLADELLAQHRTESGADA